LRLTVPASSRPPEPIEIEAPSDGAERAHVRFEPEGQEVRVPAGTPVFDAASWNGIAIDSTCGGHGTCRKC
jgi:ferredoxin